METIGAARQFSVIITQIKIAVLGYNVAAFLNSTFAQSHPENHIKLFPDHIPDFQFP